MRLIRFAGRLGAPLLVLLAVCVNAAQGAEFEVRTGYEPWRPIVVVSGKIVPGDLARFRAAVKKSRRMTARTPPLFALNSPGGSLSEGLSIGAEIQRLGFATAVLPEQICASACSLVFFGGFDAKRRKPDRTAYATSRIGVHLWGAPQNAKGQQARWPKAGSAGDPAVGAVRQFYRDLRVSDEILRRTLETRNSDLHILTEDEMARSAIATQPRARAPVPASFAEIRCKPICLPLHAAPAPYRLPLFVGDDPSDATMSGDAFRRNWSSFFARRVRIQSCILWSSKDGETWCTIEHEGRPMRLVAVASTKRPESVQLRAQCATPSPIEACRIELSGTVRLTQHGPALYQARAKFPGADQSDASLPNEDGRQLSGFNALPVIPTL